MTLTPAYGKDYKSKKAVQTAFDEGADFIIADFNHPASGRPCNKEDLIGEGISTVNIRYKKLTEIAVVKIK